MPELFGEDLQIEVFSPLVNAKPQQHPTNKDAWGWAYELVEIPQEELEKSSKAAAWKPEFLTSLQNAVLMRLCQGEDISIEDENFIAFLEDHDEDVDEFVHGLIKTNLVALDKNTLALTTFECQLMILPDGRFVGGENNTGRLTRWVMKFAEEFRSKNQKRSEQ